MGSGFRVWTAGEVVSASNVNNYLQEQTVMSFAGTAARSSAIASPEEGMLSYLQDSDTYQGYNGTNWVDLATLAGETTPSPALYHINTTAIGTTVSSVAIDGVFNSTYKNYRVVFNFDGATNTSNTVLTGRFRVGGVSDTSNNYVRRGYFASTALDFATATTTALDLGRMSTGATNINYLVLELFQPNVAARTKFFIHGFGYENGTDFLAINYQGSFESSAQIDGFELIISTGTLTGGSVNVYGYRN